MNLSYVGLTIGLQDCCIFTYYVTKICFLFVSPFFFLLDTQFRLVERFRF